MTLGELIDHTRWNLVADEAVPYAWSAEALTRWFNDAESRFAEDTHCFIDTEPPVARITTVVGTGSYALDSRVFQLLEVYNADTKQPLSRRHTTTQSYSAGTPTAYTIQPGPKMLRLYPTPDNVVNLDLVVARGPMNKMELMSDEPEIPSQYHLMLCDWVAYQALRTVDTDKGETAHADRFFAEWMRELTEAKRWFHATIGLNATVLPPQPVVA